MRGAYDETWRKVSEMSARAASLIESGRRFLIVVGPAQSSSSFMSLFNAQQRERERVSQERERFSWEERETFHHVKCLIQERVEAGGGNASYPTGTTYVTKDCRSY